jgi:hypothetical protein
MGIPGFTAEFTLNGNDLSKAILMKTGRSRSNHMLQDGLLLPAGICSRNLGACYGYCYATGNELDCLGGCHADFSICRATGGRYHFVPKFEAP